MKHNQATPAFALFTLPNIITLGNVLAGTLSIIMALKGELVTAAYLLALGALFDFLDGLVARLTQSFSPIGKELDSLADIISFGVAPALISMQLVLSMSEKMDWPTALAGYSALLIPLFSALRLAKFNVDTRQGEQFIGLPTPANALFFASLPFTQVHEWAVQFPPIIWVFLPLHGIMSLLLISEWPLFSLKFKQFTFAANRLRYGFILGAAMFLIIWQVAAIPLIIGMYILLSLVFRPTKN